MIRCCRVRSVPTCIPIHRLLTTTVNTAINRPRIVSRRAWEAYRKEHPGPKTATSSKKKADEAPWPRNFQIAGFVLGSLGIPYSIAWYLSTDKEMRDMLGLPESVLEALRQHFGSPEENTSYFDVKAGEEPHYQFEDEPVYNERLQQRNIEALQDLPSPVRISLIHPQDRSIVTSQEQVIQGSAPARPESLLQMVMGESSSPDQRQTKNVAVAVDFADLEEESTFGEQKPQQQQQEEGTLSMGESSSSFVIPSISTIYSTWYYQRPQDQQQQQQQSEQRMSQDQVHESKLKWQIETLEKDLKDPNCTRDMDDMQQELKELRAELRKLTWKRRLRLA